MLEPKQIPKLKKVIVKSEKGDSSANQVESDLEDSLLRHSCMLSITEDRGNYLLTIKSS
jgi:hypothetical protein